MQSYKKTIILTNKENKSNDIATLNLEQKSNGIFGRIKYFGNENGAKSHPVRFGQGD